MLTPSCRISRGGSCSHGLCRGFMQLRRSCCGLVGGLSPFSWAGWSVSNGCEAIVCSRGLGFRARVASVIREML